MTKKTILYIWYWTSFIIVTIFIFILSFWVRNEGIKISKENYQILSEQKDAIVNDFNKIYNYDNYSIEETEQGVKVSLKIDSVIKKLDIEANSTMICYFNNNYELIDYEYIEPRITKSYIGMIITVVLVDIIGVIAFIHYKRN